MNKNALLDYALYARQELETQIALSLNNLGITKDGVANIRNVGDVYVIDGIQDSVSYRVYELRNRIIEGHIKNATFEDVVEEFAYTWFNRIVAIRFMEVHDYFSHGFRVLSSRDGSYEPEILKNLAFVAGELNLDERIVQEYQSQEKLEDLYRYVLVQQCNALRDVIPMLFEEKGAYLELLLPNNLLSQDSVIRAIEDIPEEDFLNDIEIVGWLYQFYNSVKKDEVFASKKKITKETLPAVTQLFTPDWIVRYMAENSIGRIWMESYPNSPMKSEMKYYVDDSEQTEEVQKKIDEIKYKNVKPEDIRIIEPCCGSGHILVYAFDLLNQMYLEKGYEKREIPGLILKNNLYGLDVDKRAAQLAQFALIMKARSIDNRFFNDDRYVLPKVYEIFDSQAIEDDYREHMKTLKFSKESIDTAYYLVKTFKDGKIIGSLLKVEERDYTAFIEELEKVKTGDIPGLFEMMFFNYGLDILKQLAELSIVLSQKYDVMITNPPYIGPASMVPQAKKYANENYSRSKSDMFAMFMETELVRDKGFTAMINMHGWMFLDSYHGLRESLLDEKSLINMVHLGARAFESIGGEVVQTTTFVMRSYHVTNYNGVFYRLTNENSQSKKESAFLDKKNVFTKSQDDFYLIPGCPIAYWKSQIIMESFKDDDLDDKLVFRQGMTTTDNEKYLRFWHEVSLSRIGFGITSREDSVLSNKKWFPYHKGGEYRKWYGNNYYVVYYLDDGKELIELVTKKYPRISDPEFIIKNRNWYFKEGLTWSTLSTGTLGVRYSTHGFIFDAKGSMAFTKDASSIVPYIALLNSKVSMDYLDVLSPTLDFNIVAIKVIPLLEPA